MRCLKTAYIHLSLRAKRSEAKQSRNITHKLTKHEIATVATLPRNDKIMLNCSFIEIERINAKTLTRLMRYYQ